MHELVRHRGGNSYQLSQISVTINGSSDMKQICCESGDPTLGGVCLHRTMRKQSLKNDRNTAPVACCAWGRSGMLVHGIFSSTQEVNEWRCRRHESRSDL